jgi:NADH dehydrogenase
MDDGTAASERRAAGAVFPTSDAGPPRVVVIGAGFAGLTAVRTLHSSGVDVTLVDRNPYSTFQPLLYQVATSGLSPSDVAYPLRAFARRNRARFRRGDLARLDTAARRVVLSDGGTLDYDYLILAIGVTAAFFGIPGAAEHSWSLYTRRDAVALRNRLDAALDRLSEAGPGSGLAVTIVGGGATGVELAGTLAELRNIALPAAYPDVDRASFHVRLIEQAGSLITPFDPVLRRYAYRQLQQRGVDVRTGTSISGVSHGSVTLAGGTELASDITVWAAGVAAPDLVKDLGLEQGRHGLLATGEDLRVHGQDRVFAAGDIALIEGNPVGQLAQPAIQLGRHAAENIQRLIAGKPTTTFRYFDKGTMATIGRRSAVVQLPGHLRFRGTIAWFMWLGLHMFYLLGGRNRLSAMVNLAWRYLTWKHTGGVLAGDEPDPGDDSASRELPGR